MEEQEVGKKEGLDCMEDTLEILQTGMDEGEVLERTILVGNDQIKDRVYMGNDQILKGVDQFRHEVLESSNGVSELSKDVLDFANDVAKVHAVVLEGVSDKDKFKGKVLEDGVDTGEFQDKVLTSDATLNTPENKSLKENVNEDAIHDTVLEDSVCLAKAIEVPNEAVDMNKIQNQLEDFVDMGETLDEVLKGSVDVYKNGVNLKNLEPLERLNVEDALKALERRMETRRCQVRITIRRNLQLRMANRTAQNVYVRLLSHGERIAGSGLLALKNSVLLSPIKPSLILENHELDVMTCETQAMEQEDSSMPDTEQEEEESEEEMEEDDEDGSHAISDTAYSPCSSVMPTPVEETQGGVGVDFLLQSPGRLLKELHANPEIQAELWAEQQRELAREDAYHSLCDTPHIPAFFNSAVRLITVASILLLLLLVLLLVLLESDLDVSFLQDIRETPEFEQFHYEYYCPLRRWLCYKLQLLKEHMWGD